MVKRKRQPDSGGAKKSPKKQKKMLDFLVPTTGEPSSRAAAADGPFSLAALLTEPSWKRELDTEFRKPYFKEIQKFLDGEYQKKKEIFPPKAEIFNAFNLTPLNGVKVVILGQDPYHDNGQAHGLCFSVLRGVAPPPSLKNIFRELDSDIAEFRTPSHGCLEDWANRGVLLLNATLTVEAHKANSHSAIGWQKFTDACMELVSRECEDVVFILWGGFAQKKEKLIDAKKHVILKAAHPSPLSVSKFLGCKCFSAANKALADRGKTPVDWRLD